MLVPEALVPGPQAPMGAPGWFCGRKHKAVRPGRAEAAALDPAKGVVAEVRVGQLCTNPSRSPRTVPGHPPRI